MTDETAAEFDLASLETSDEAVLAIKDRNGNATTWLWTFYGPGHPKTLAVGERQSRRWLEEARQKEQAQVNGKKWKAADRSLADIQAEQVTNIVDRLKGFTPVKLAGETIEFTPDTARKLLLDPRKALLFNQVAEFLREQENFIQPSARS